MDVLIERSNDRKTKVGNSVENYLERDKLIKVKVPIS